MNKLLPGQATSEIRVIVYGRCAGCSDDVVVAERHDELVSAVSLARLLELVNGADWKCGCGGRASRGEALAVYRLPGAGPWVVAARPLIGGDAELSIRNCVPSRRSEGLIAFIGANELDAAGRLGQPISARSAWHEALMMVELGMMQTSFACGAGVRCVASTSRHPEAIDLLDLDGIENWVSAERLAAMRNGGPYCGVLVDHDIVRGLVVGEAARLGLAAEAIKPSTMWVSREGGRIGAPVDVDELLRFALGHALPLALVAQTIFAALRDRLTELEQLQASVERRYELKGRCYNGKLCFPRAGGKTAKLDVERYLLASPHERIQLVSLLERELA